MRGDPLPTDVNYWRNQCGESTDRLERPSKTWLVVVDANVSPPSASGGQRPQVSAAQVIDRVWNRVRGGTRTQKRFDAGRWRRDFGIRNVRAFTRWKIGHFPATHSVNHRTAGF